MFDSFETHTFRWNLRGQGPLHICPWGDTHDCAKASIDDHINDLRKRTEKMPHESVLFIGMGDYGDFASTSERAAIHHGALHDTTIDKLDNLANEDLKRRVKQLEFMRGRIVGLHCGNHDWKFSDSSYASERMAEMLGCKHLGYSAYTRIRVSGCLPHNKTTSYVDIFSSHGKGSGRLVGSPFNTVEQMNRVFHDADIYMMGHDHSKGGIPDTRLYVEENNQGELVVKEKVRYYVRTGSSLRGYEAGTKSYISKAMYKPCALGFPVVTAEWKRSTATGHDIISKEIHCWS